MSKECKKARNAVGLAAIMLVIIFWLVLITFLSSCYTVHPNTCNNLQVTNCPCTK